MRLFGGSGDCFTDCNGKLRRESSVCNIPSLISEPPATFDRSHRAYASSACFFAPLLRPARIASLPAPNTRLHDLRPIMVFGYPNLHNQTTPIQWRPNRLKNGVTRRWPDPL